MVPAGGARIIFVTPLPEMYRAHGRAGRKRSVFHRTALAHPLLRVAHRFNVNA